MNELDSQLVTGQLRQLGYTFTDQPAQAQVVLYNTCSVREHAEQKVWSRLGELALRKAREPALVVGVLGCMAEREGAGLIKRMPVVDLMVGPAELDKLPALLDNAVKTRASLLHGGATLSLLATPDDQKPDVSLLRSAGQVALHGYGSGHTGQTNRRSATLAAAADTLELLDLSRSTGERELSAGGRSAYVRITRGCNKFCTYCVVPFTRGAEVHRPPGHIIDECKRLADAGVIEVTLLGQTVNHYRFEHAAAVTIGGLVQPQKGRAYAAPGPSRADPYRGERVTTFADLLRQIHDQVPAIRRLRFVTSFPRSFGDDVLDAIADCPRICRYLHVPAQSGSDRILKLMNRGYTVGEYLEFLDRARARLDQPQAGRPLTVAGDIIVGFPTETDEDHAATVALLRRAAYKNCFIFKYSPRPGTVAIDRFEDDVPDEVKRERNQELLALQQGISAEVSAAYVGRTVEVFVEGVSPRAAKAIGRARTPEPRSGVALTVHGEPAGNPAADREPAEALDGQGQAVGAGGDGSSTDGRVQMVGRTDGDLIVFFDASESQSLDSLIGRVERVRVERSSALALFGSTVQTN